MTQKVKLPARETIQRHVANMHEACQKLDAFTLALDEL